MSAADSAMKDSTGDETKEAITAPTIDPATQPTPPHSAANGTAVDPNAPPSTPAQSNKNPEAEAHKEEGNKLFAAKHFAKAIDCYTAAIDIDASNAIYYSNRAFCHIRLEAYGSAIEDATAAIKCDARFVKAYYRRASALFALSKLREARRDFQQVVRIHPRDKDAQAKLSDIDKELRRQAFLKAIESEKGKPVSETIGEEVKEMTVEEAYDGPRLKEEEGVLGRVTVDAAFIKALLEHFRAQNKLPRRYVYQLLLAILPLFRALPSLVRVPVPASGKITVCGDVHGQYYDVLNLFSLNGLPSESNPYLFNGDFVDRGSFSLEVILLFFALKLCYPAHFHMTRGNHESLNMNNIYGFQGEVAAKVDARCFELFTEVFNHLPLAALLQPEQPSTPSALPVFVTHGGLFSTDDVTLADIEKCPRVQQPPETGLMCEILWSDPQRAKGRGPSKRGVGLSFGPDVTARFCEKNGVGLVVRSHEVKEEGYEVDHDGKLVTVFSAPNYVRRQSTAERPLRRLLSNGCRSQVADMLSVCVRVCSATRWTTRRRTSCSTARR